MPRNGRDKDIEMIESFRNDSGPILVLFIGYNTLIKSIVKYCTNKTKMGLDSFRGLSNIRL
jgi:hypothetical protein